MFTQGAFADDMQATHANYKIAATFSEPEREELIFDICSLLMLHKKIVRMDYTHFFSN